MGVTVVLCAVSAVLGALAGGLWFRRREKRTLQSLDGMLDQAICGEFSPTKFDESLFSAVESRLADYLEASAVSARNLQAEKDAIKTLIGDISHQTKTPIANLLLYAQLLGEQPLPPQGRDCAAALERQAEKLKTLIEALVKTSPGERHPDLSACGGAPGPYAGTGGGGTPAQGGQEGDHTDPAAHPGPGAV